MLLYRFTVGDWFKLAWFALTSGRERELERKLSLYESAIDRLIGEKDAAFTENERLHAELAKALLELANERARMGRALAPSLKAVAS